jgi:SOS-response transcriptional repressor LexA
MATDYMEPQIIMGDTVAVEMEQDFGAPDTYFFQIGDAHQVAYLKEEDDGTVRIVPANPFYSTIIVDPAEVQFHVHGRVWGRVHRV